MAIARWIGLRVAQLVVTLVVASVVVYGSIFLVPGDPATFLGGGKALSPEALQAIREQYGLSQNFFVQYAHWVGGILHGDFGLSVQYRQPVLGVLESRIPTTLMLVVLAGIIVVVFGVGLGGVAALFGRRTDAAITFGVTVLAAVPSFVAAIVLILVFAVMLDWLPSGGDGAGLGDQLVHLVLPAIALAVAYLAIVARVTRSSMRSEKFREHVDMATSRGLSRWVVIRRHIFWNALTPISTVVALVLAGLIGGTTVVESAFGLHGLGSLLVNSVQSKDFPIVQAVVLLLVAAYVIVNTIADFIALIIDPKVRTGAAA